jgi:hypothetical protein
MSKTLIINDDNEIGFSGIGLKGLPPQDLMDEYDYVPLGGDEKKNGPRGSNFSNDNKNNSGSFSSSFDKDFKYGSYSASSSSSSGSSSTTQPDPNEKEVLIQRLSMLTAHRDDLINRSHSRQHSKYDQELTNTLQWIAEIENTLKDQKEGRGSKERAYTSSSSSSSGIEEDFKSGPSGLGVGSRISGSSASIAIDITDDKYPTSLAAWGNLQNVIGNVNRPVKEAEIKNRSKTSNFLSWACCTCLPKICKTTFVLLAAGTVIGAALYLKAQSDIAAAYQAEEFHPGDSTNDSINALGAITQDLYNLVNNVWPRKELSRVGYTVAGVLGLVWTIEFFIYRYIHHHNVKTRKAGENTHQVTEAQTSVIKKLVQELKFTRENLEMVQDDLDKSNTLVHELKKTVDNLIGGSLPVQKPDTKETVSSQHTVADGKRSGGEKGVSSTITIGLPPSVTSQFLDEVQNDGNDSEEEEVRDTQKDSQFNSFLVSSGNDGASSSRRGQQSPQKGDDNHNVISGGRTLT